MTTAVNACSGIPLNRHKMSCTLLAHLVGSLTEGI